MTAPLAVFRCIYGPFPNMAERKRTMALPAGTQIPLCIIRQARCVPLCILPLAGPSSTGAETL